MDDQYLRKLINDTVISVTKKMTGVSLAVVTVPTNRPANNPVLKILITDKEKREITALYSASVSTFFKIASYMKEEPVEDDAEMVIYLKEYFNVLCGNIVSCINRERKAFFRFGVPAYHEQGLEQRENPTVEMVYDMDDGRIHISWMGAELFYKTK